jgi:hypothetical protein
MEKGRAFQHAQHTVLFFNLQASRAAHGLRLEVQPTDDVQLTWIPDLQTLFFSKAPDGHVTKPLKTGAASNHSLMLL